MGWGTEAQGANSLPQSFCGGAGRPGHWMSGLQGRQVTTDWLAARPGLWWSSWVEAPYSWRPGETGLSVPLEHLQRTPARRGLGRV